MDGMDGTSELYGIMEGSVQHLSFFLRTESRRLTEGRRFLTKSVLQDILAVQSPSFTSLPFSQRFQIAVNSRGWPAESFMELLTSEEPAEIALTSDWGGKQAIHWAAAHFGESTRPAGPGNVDEPPEHTTTSYAELSSRLIVAGADVHALVHEFDSPPSDPFLYFLHGTRHTFNRMYSFLSNPNKRSRWNQRSLSMAIRRWGEMLVNAGQSLLQYAEAETRFLSTSDFNVDYSSKHRRLHPKSLVVIEGSGLAMYATTFVKITQWSQERTHVPGSWPNSCNPAPKTIIWKPEIEDQCEGFRWTKKIETFTVESSPFLVEHTCSGSFTTALLEARKELITGTQDDHGPVSRMTIQETNSRLRRSARRGRRAASVPPSVSTWRDLSHTEREDFSKDPTQNMSVAFGNESLMGFSKRSRAHKCPFDGRWRICGSRFDKVSWRRCMRGEHDLLAGRVRSSYVGQYMTWERKLFESEDHVDVAERYSRRFHPEMMGRVQESRRRARELAELKIAFPAESFPPSEYSLAHL